jgi:hypothetical protein
MSKQLENFLTLLRKQPVSTSNVVNLLEKGNTASLLGIDGLIGSLASYKEEDLPYDIVTTLIGTTELSINQQKNIAEAEMNSRIIANNFNNYQENITSAVEDISDTTIINDYNGKSDGTNLEYYILHSPIPEKSFMIGELLFQISPISSIPVTLKDGSKSFISYKFIVKITTPNNPISLKLKFEKLRISTFYHIIGMSFLKPKDVSIVQNVDLYIMEINTFNFYEELALKYNNYYSNLKKLDDTKLTEITDIESCQFDSNGLILVPKLFFLSSIYTDSNIGDRPFIWADNEGLSSIPIKMNNYKITLNVDRNLSHNEIDVVVESLISRIKDFGIELSIIQPKDGNRGSKINLSIVGYHQYSEDNKKYQSDYSSRLNLESKVSAVFRKLCQFGLIGSYDYDIKGTNDSIGTEKYSFVYNTKIRTIEANYEYGVNKFVIYYNRSACTTPSDNDGKPDNLVKAIEDRNYAKFMNTGIMINSLEQGGQKLEYQGNEWPTFPGDFIPSSFITLVLTKTENFGKEKIDKKYIGISWLPFGFTKYVSTNLNVVLNESGFSIYGSDIEMTPITVRKVLKLSTNPRKITNINQVIFESETVPEFNGYQPLKISKLDDNHYLCLFRTSHKIEPTTKINWTYISDYMQNTDFISTEINASKTLTFILDGEKFINFSKRSILRYFSETLSIISEFNSVIFNNLDIIFNNGNFISLENFCKLFISSKESASISTEELQKELPQKFFELLSVAAHEGTINDNVIDCISLMLQQPENNSLQSLRNFIKSIKIPVKSNDYPIFNVEMQMSITNELNEEINNAVDIIFSISDSLIDKTDVEIFNIATSQSGILRTLIEMIAKNISDSGIPKASLALIVEFKNSAIMYLKSLIENPILPDLIGTQITSNFISNAAERLNKVIFYRLIKLINQELTVIGYEDIIVDLCKSVTSPDEAFIITVISSYRYIVVFNESLIENIFTLNGTFIPDIEMNLTVTDDKTHVNEFGEYVYDSNVHIMFEVVYPDTKNINDIILSSITAGSIYYTQITDVYVLPDLNLVSLYEIPSESNNSRKVKFFLPFTFNGAKLTVDKTSWTHEESEFKLLNKTVEIELASEGIINYQSAVKRLIYETLINISPVNLKTIRSIMMGSNPVKKGYTLEGKQSHYLFTSDLNDLLTSGIYTDDNDLISENLWRMIPNGQISIFIHPIPSIVCLCYYRICSYDKETIKNVGKALSLPKAKTNIEVDKFTNNFRDSFKDEFQSVDSQRDTILITRNKKGIYTSVLNTRSVEIQIASGITSYHENPIPFDLSDLDRLNDIEVIAVREQVNLENERLHRENIKHNLALVLSTIKWNSKQIENYRFFSDEKPKWMKFSKNSLFMAIGFQGGVKIYIRSGDQYVFCTNLIHESVSDIIFGNVNLCVTIQYQNYDKPFAKLWIAAAGIQVNIPLDFYQVVTGDAANIKYISGTTNKEKKNIFINVVDNKVMFGNIVVQAATPIFDHNVYFFSPNDDYFIYNSKGTFKVVDMNKMDHIELVSNVSLIKPFENGTWITNNQFIGTTYSANSVLNKQKVLINVENMTAIQSQILPEFPLITEAESMVVEGYTKIHPLYSYLVKERDNYKNITTGKIGQTGIWIYDLYISIKKNQDKIIFFFNTVDGFYDSSEIDDLSYSDQSEIDYLSILISGWTYKTIKDITGIHVESIIWIDKLLFMRSNCDRSEMIKLQCIDGNYFSFFGDSIFVWSYPLDGTELTHIDSNGFEKLFFDAQVAIIVSSIPKAGKFEGDRLVVLDINLEQTVTYDKEAVDITAIVKPVKEKSQVKMMAFTEISYETYSNNEVVSVIVDSRSISSSLCLNRYPEYTLKSHVESGNVERFTPYDNLLISCEGNVVKIIPRSIQTTPSIDGLVSDWYRSQTEDSPEHWNEKLSVIKRYFSNINEMIPQLSGLKPIAKLDYDFISNNLKSRTSSNFEMGINEFIKYEWPQYLIDTFRTIFRIMKHVNYIYNPDTLINHVKEFWDIISSKNPFAMYMKEIPEANKEQKYNEAINAFAILAGDNFISYKVGSSFRMIYESQFTIHFGQKKTRTIESFKDILITQLPTVDLKTRQKIELILLIVNIPYINVSIVNLATFKDYVSRLVYLKDEMNRIIKMTERTVRYDKYRCMEIDKLMVAYNIYLRRSMSYTTKMYPAQSEVDFALCLKARYEPINESELPKGIVFDNHGIAVVGTICYFDLSNKIPVMVSKRIPILNSDKTPILDSKGIPTFTITETTTFVNGEIKTYAKMPNETFMLISMIEVTKSLNSKIKDWISTKGREIIKDGTSIFDIVGLLDGRNLGTDEVNLQSYKTQLLQSLRDDLLIDYQLDQISLAKTKLIEDLKVIYVGKKNFPTIDSLFDLLDEVIKERFPKSLFIAHTTIPIKFQKILDTYTTKISDDSDDYLLEYNIPHIGDLFKFYSESLGRNYFIAKDGYTEDMLMVKKKLVPLLWNYRNGVADERMIPVTAIKLVFSQPVKFKNANLFKQNEKDDLIFEYEIPKSDRLHDELYGTVTINLIDIIRGFEDRSELTPNYDINEIRNAIDGISYDADILKEAMDSKLITEDNVKVMIRSLLVKVNGPYRSIQEYKNLLEPTYTMNNLRLPKNEQERDSNYLINFYPRSTQMSITTTELRYFFDYITAGLDFEGDDVSMNYKKKPASIINSLVNLSKTNFSIGSFRPVLFEPKLITTSDGNPAKFTDSSGSDFIAYYGNTIIDQKNRGFLVTQRLIDRKMTSYFYVKTFTFPDGRRKDRLDVATYIVSIESGVDGDLKVIEKIDDRRFEKGKGMVDILVEKDFRTHISTLIHQWRKQDEMDELKFNESVINNVKIITKGTVTVTISNYKSGRFFGSLIEITEIINAKIEVKANWNFYLIDIKNFDFNETELIIIGTVYSVTGYNVRVGIMDLKKRQSEKKPIFIQTFDREIRLGNSLVESIDNITIIAGVTSYIIYRNDKTLTTNDDSKTNFLIILNANNSYESQFNTDITSIRVSKESGYVALYFDKTDTTQIWSAAGSLYRMVQGECNWM